MRAERAVDEESSLDEAEEGEPEAPPARKSSLKMPDIRADIRALPEIFRSRRLLVVPLILLAVGWLLQLTFFGLPEEVRGIAELYIQYFFLPPTLFTFFLAGFLAPRASYLVGAIFGLIGGLMWSVWIVLFGTSQAVSPSDGTSALTADLFSAVANVLVLELIFGTFAAALAAWYRDFLRGMQDRGRARRAEREAEERAKRREERQQSRRVAKQRPTN